MFLVFCTKTSIFDLLTVQILSENRSDYLNSITTFLARVGGMPFVCFYPYWCVYYQAWYKKYITVIFISVGVLGSIITVWLLKWCVDRQDLHRYIILSKVMVHRSCAHSVYASTLACMAMIMLCHKLNTNSPYIILISVFGFICMGLSRIYAGVHFPTDVLAGWGIGFIWIALLWLWLLQTQSRLSRKQIYF